MGDKPVKHKSLYHTEASGDSNEDWHYIIKMDGKILDVHFVNELNSLKVSYMFYNSMKVKTDVKREKDSTHFRGLLKTIFEIDRIETQEGFFDKMLS